MNNTLDCALRLLARREHGAWELANKLARKGYNSIDIAEAVEKCQSLGLQSDVRFVETLCRMRIQQGCGPLKILQELQAKQIARELIDGILDQEQENWLSHAQVVWNKKFRSRPKLSCIELQKGQRFLTYRGFPADIIAKIVHQKTTSF
jgi:regulatory protein